MGYYDWIFAIGTTAVLMDAMGCGANDVANSMATSVNSKTLTMMQAMVVATIFEILGAMTLGSYNASTIRSSIITLSYFNNKGGAFMFGMMCSVISSCIFNFLSNRFGWATSSTHATIGALIGVGVASGAGVSWGYVITTKNGVVSGQNGMGAVIASFAISPALAGCIGAVVYTLVKTIVMDRKGNGSFQWALRSLPFWYAFVFAFEAWLIAWKSPRTCSATVGAPCIPAYSDNEIIALYFGTFGVTALVTFLFVVPYVHRTVWRGWSGLTVAHLPFMVLPDSMVLKMFPGVNKTQPWFDDRHLNGIEVPESESWAWTERDQKLIARMRGVALAPTPTTADGAATPGFTPKDAIAAAEEGNVEDPAAVSSTRKAVNYDAATAEGTATPTIAAPAKMMSQAGIETTYQPILAYKSAWGERLATYKADMANKEMPIHHKAYKFLKFWLLFGVDRDIADHGLDNAEVATIHDNATKYNGKTESVFRFLQILTSSLACFAHGANDVGLSVGPLAVMHYLWSNGPNAARVAMKSSIPVQDWQLGVAAVCLVLGLWFYGYNMMRVLGNRLTFHSPSRGFAMEMGSAITILIAARNGIPVSTTNCIVGSTIGVGIASGGFKNVNWKLTFFTLSTWILTLPFCGLMSGMLFAFGTYAPSVDCVPIKVGPSPGMSTYMLNGVNYTAAQTIWPAGC